MPKRIIETETGYNRETVDKLLIRFEEYEKIYYCEKTKEIYIRNWIKHNRANSPMVKKCIIKELESIKNKEFVDIFIKVCNEYGYSIDSVSRDYGEKEKQKEKQKQKEEEKEKQKQKDKQEQKHKEVGNDLGKYKVLYEQNVGLINSIIGEWLIEISNEVEYDLFKKAIEIATNKGRCNKGYISGILKQWRINKITTIKELKAYEVGLSNKGDEDEKLYRKPTKEELDRIKEEFRE